MRSVKALPARPRADQAMPRPEVVGDRSRYYLLKRAFDSVLSVAGLLVLSPVLILVAVLIKLDSPGPVIFHQERVGYDWRRRRQTTFVVCKFRSMNDNCDQSLHQELVRDGIRHRRGAEGHAGSVKLSNDRRITRLGRFIRKTSIDELPQLWNVMLGAMSLVGPRPVTLYEVAEYDAWPRRRLEGVPGVTGPV